MPYTDSPISPNPSIENPNATSAILKWSPPFLWPGHSIQYYNISIINDRRITYSYLLNATFSDVTVSFTTFAEDSTIESCDTLEFFISAVSSDSDTESEDLTTFHVYGGYIPSITVARDLYRNTPDTRSPSLFK